MLYYNVEIKSRYTLTCHSNKVQFNEAFTELKNTLEPSILSIGRSLQGEESDKETGLAGIQDQIALLSTIRSNEG